jgi:hypothetical protein
MENDYLILKRASANWSSGQWNDDDFDVLADSRIFHAAASPVGTPWMWTVAFGHHENRTPTHGYEATREAAMAAFAKSRAAIGEALRAFKRVQGLTRAALCGAEQPENSLLPFCYPTR